MSYILDALKKAAEQRTGPSVEVRRLLSAPQIRGTSRARYVALAVAGVGVLGAAVVLWIWAPASHVGAPPVTPVASPVTPIASIAPAPAAAVPAPATVLPAPAAVGAPAVAARDGRLREAPDDKPAPPVPASAPRDHASRPSAADAGRAASAKPRVADTPPPRPAPASAANVAPTPPAPPTATPAPRARITAAPTPPVVAAVPPTPASATARGDGGKLKVEVIVYSEQPSQRWAFISGRKYVEGDSIGDSGRVEEIQSAGVVIVEDGRRVTLRP